MVCKAGNKVPYPIPSTKAELAYANILWSIAKQVNPTEIVTIATIITIWI